MFNWLTIAFLSLALWSCVSRKPKGGFEEIADFGLSDDGTGVKVDDKAYFDDLKRSESSVAFDSSLPLPLRVGKSGDSFDQIPHLAKPGLESRMSIYMGPCQFTLLSGTVQVDRYLLAGQWIKLTEGLPAKTPVKLEPNQDLNIKAVTKLSVEISETMNPICRRMFEGRKVLLGRFHLNKSRLGLIPGPGAPNISFGARSNDPQGKLVFIYWLNGSNVPTLIDDFDFPATAESGIFRAQMANKGYYYLAFQTVLRMDQVDSMVIKLPFNPATAQKALKAAATQSAVPSSGAGVTSGAKSPTAPSGQAVGTPSPSLQLPAKTSVTKTPLLNTKGTSATPASKTATPPPKSGTKAPVKGTGSLSQPAKAGTAPKGSQVSPPKVTKPSVKPKK